MHFLFCDDFFHLHPAKTGLGLLASTIMDTLKKILEYKTLELEHRRRRIPIKDLEHMAADTEPAQGFLDYFKTEQINIIAELKKASPSAGTIRKDFDPVRIAHAYQEGGARAISVLTDEHFFHGSLTHLKDVKAAVQLPVLRKDFTLDLYHVFEARAYGADAILLIVAALDDYQLKDFHDLATELGMTPLVEVHNQEELERSFKINIKLLGINNRNLNTFNVKLETSLELLAANKIEVPVIVESGLKDQTSLLKLKEFGAAGFLIGETLLMTKDIKEKVRELLYVRPS